MAPQHDTRERHGSHLPAEWAEPAPERPHGERMMDDVQMEPPGEPRALSWPVVKEAAYVAGGILGFVLTGAATYYGVVGEVRDSRKDIESLTARVVLIEQGRAQNLPRLEEALRANGLQDQRIQNLTEALGSLRLTVVDIARSLAEQGSKIADAHEKSAILEERLGHAGPHDR